MTQIEKLKALIPEIESNIAETYLDMAKHVILSRRNPFGYAENAEIEPCYKYLQINIAVELFNKRGAEGEIRHTEGGIDRTYENANVSESLLSSIVPKVKIL